MKQTLANAKEDEKGIAGQACNDKPFRMKKDRFYKYLIVVIFCLLCGTVAAEELLKSEYAYRHYTTKDGLPQMRCNAVFQDSRGFIWVGTESGFSRYNGLEFVNFFPTQNIQIHKFYEDEKGNVVAVGNYSHYKVLADDKVKIFVPHEGLVFREFYSLALPQNYGVYVDNNEHKAIYYVESDTLVKVLECVALDKMGKDDFCFVYFDNKDSLWYIPTGKDGLYTVDTKGNELEYHKGYFESVFRFKNNVYAMDYVQDVGGLLKKQGDNFKLIYKHWFAGNTAFVPLNDSTLIMKCSNNLYQYNTNSNRLEILFTHIGYSMSIRDIIKDNENNIWIATRAGLYNFFNLKFKKYQMNFNGQENNIITGITENPENNYYFGTLKADLAKISPDGQQHKLFFPKTTWENGWQCFFSTPFVENKNTMWATSCVALLKIQNDKLKFLTDERYFMRYVFPAGNDIICALCSDVVIFLDKQGNLLKKYSNKDLLQQGRYLSDFIIYKNQKVFAGESGLSILDNAGKISLMDDAVLKSAIALAPDKMDLLWVIAENRLCVWNGDSVKLVYTFDNCLVRSAKCVNGHFLLVSTTQGFALFDLRTYYEGKPIKAYFYDQFNGFMGVEPLFKGIFEDSNGTVWIMCQNGTFRFNPEQLLKEQQPPRLLISNYYSADNLKWKNIETQTKTTLSYFNNNVRFSFIGISFSATQHVRYYYRLLGFQNEWSEPTKQREVTFNNLPYGDYVFEIYADTGTDDSKSEVHTFSFTIKPAFWQTTWFIVAAILALMLVSAGIALFYQRRKNRDLFEKLETEKQLNELRIRSIRLKAIPHFNANVLAAIEYYIMNKPKEEAIAVLETYSAFTFQTLQDVDKASRPLSAEIDYVKTYLDLEKLRFGNKFD
ncbi:MAG: histidine kinase, partial [Prevotellaceae bacterium]|nr:histidine kinase [Prevotellaceae bacterium]